MGRKVLRGLRHNALGLVAIFVALGGIAFALQNNSVKSKHIKNGQVKSADLKGGAVKSGKIKPGAVGAVQQADRTRSFQIPLGSVALGSSPPGSGISNGTAPVLTFGPSADESIAFSFQIPDDWDGNSDFELALLWNAVASTGNVVWTITYHANQPGEQLSSGIPDTSVQALSSPGASAFHLVRKSLTISAADVDPGDEVIFVKLYRDGDEQMGNDDMAGDALLSQLTVSYGATD